MSSMVERPWPAKGEWGKFLWHFGVNNAFACTFPFALVGCLALTKALPIPGIARYDLLFFLCLAIQGLMVWRNLETWRDAAVVGVFHLLGIGLEIYKVNQGSWSYPEPGILKIAGAPLYAGFMHGSVASFMCLAWKRFKLRSSGWPSAWVTWGVAGTLYTLFFIPIDGPKYRLITLAIVILLFAKSKVHYSVNRCRYWMPMPLAFLLIGSMIYIAENLATFFGAWMYPYQTGGWQPVHLTKMVSWSLLMTVSLVIVAEYKRALGLLTQKNGATDGSCPVEVQA